MADLANPIVSVSYQCGCSFTDDTEQDGLTVPVLDENGKPAGTTVLTGGKRWRFGGDETRIFQAKLRLADAKGAAAKRAILTEELAKITDTAKPTRASLEAKATDDVYAALLTRTADDVPQDTVADADTGKTTRFPRPPALCPRHAAECHSTHASYLNPEGMLLSGSIGVGVGVDSERGVR